MRSVIFFLLLVAGQLACTSCQQLLWLNGANGTEAVLLAIARIQQSGIFGNDNQLLRRIAYVETRDGTLPDTFRDGYHGGIWAVNEVAFNRTKNTSANSRLPSKLMQIQHLGVFWEQVQWNDLRKPLHSAIAARLVLFIASSAIPSASDLEAQATFWKQNFNPSGETSVFVALSSSLEGEWYVKPEAQLLQEYAQISFCV